MDGNDNLKLSSIKQCDTIDYVEDGGEGVNTADFKACCLDQGVGDSDKSATCVEA